MLGGTGLVDEFISYPVDLLAWGRLLNPWRKLALLRRLRRAGFGTLVYLIGDPGWQRRVARDKRFFAAAGMHQFVAMEGAELPLPQAGSPLP